eukprot:symbB.v1.2.027925.t1/scaffold2891.1/size67802/7
MAFVEAPIAKVSKKGSKKARRAGKVKQEQVVHMPKGEMYAKAIAASLQTYAAEAEQRHKEEQEEIVHYVCKRPPKTSTQDSKSLNYKEVVDVPFDIEQVVDVHNPAVIEVPRPVEQAQPSIDAGGQECVCEYLAAMIQDMIQGFLQWASFEEPASKATPIANSGVFRGVCCVSRK